MMRASFRLRRSRILRPCHSRRTNAEATAESIQLERKQFRAAHPLLASTLGTMKLDAVFHLPGGWTRVSGFETNGTRTLRVRFDGSRVLILNGLGFGQSTMRPHHLMSECEPVDNRFRSAH